MSQAYSSVSYSSNTTSAGTRVGESVDRSITNMVDTIVRSHKTICPPNVFKVLESRGWSMAGGGGPDITFSKEGYYLLTWGEALAVENMLMFMELEA